MIFGNLLFILILLMGFGGVHAEDEDDIIRQCLDFDTEPTPLADFTFDGMILFSSTDGTRVIRNPIPTTYIIGFADHYRNFASHGSLSPDGQWFAYPTGTSYRANWFDRHYLLDRINFINTYTGELVFYIPVDDRINFNSGSARIQHEYATQRWLNDTQYILTRKSHNPEDIVVYDVETQAHQPYEGAVPLRDLRIGRPSPDGTQMILGNQIIDPETGEVVFESETRIHWLQDGSGYYMQPGDPEGTHIYDRAGNLLFSHNQDRTDVSQTGRWIGWSLQNQDERTYFIMNTETEEIVNLCAPVLDVAFSPDDTQVVLQVHEGNFGHRLWFLDLATWQATPLDQTGVLGLFLGWWPIP